MKDYELIEVEYDEWPADVVVRCSDEYATFVVLKLADTDQVVQIGVSPSYIEKPQVQVAIGRMKGGDSIVG